LVSVPTTFADLRSLRFMLADFLVRRWLPNGRRLISLPVPLSATRFFVPLWVFCFDIPIPFTHVRPDCGPRSRPQPRTPRTCATKAPCGSAPLGPQHHYHVPAVQVGLGFDIAYLGQISRHPPKQPLAQVRVHQLSTAEHDGQLDLVALL
jgi:hypothetical protein